MENVTREELVLGGQQVKLYLDEIALEIAEDGEQNIIATHKQQEQDGLPDRKRRRASLEDTGISEDRLDQIIEQRFQIREQELLERFEREIDQRIQHRFQRFEQKFEQKFDQRFDQRTEQRSGKSLEQSTNQRPFIETHTLFSDEDNENVEWTDPIPTKSEHDFTTCMEKFLESYIVQPPSQSDGRMVGTTFRNIRIAILDTGFYEEEEDYFLQGAESRIKLKENFCGPDPKDCQDYHGHGTHVARLLLRFAPEADIYVAKVSDSRFLEKTTMDRLVRALRWAGEHADIINLSFGLAQMRPLATSDFDLGIEINRLVREKKLIFAAASNTGGNGSRPWPASHPGVFCIHATDERGVTNPRMNPTALGNVDNFATLGDKIESYWGGKRRCISGTSFATPIAAAIAANVLDFARRHLAPDDANMFARYGVMRILFRNHMTENGDANGVYHYIKPWRKGLWEVGAESVMVVEKLKEIAIHCT